MSWDLALVNGDLVFAANRDLAGISGTDLLEQRMKTRLRVLRASWVYDRDGTFGSNLHRLIGMAPEAANTAVIAYVREALRPMDKEISIEEITNYYELEGGGLTDQPDPAARAIVIVVRYQVIAESEGITASEDRQLEISLPAYAGGGG